MIGAVAEETRMCCCNSAIKIQISNRNDAVVVRTLLKAWLECHAACMDSDITPQQ